MASQSLCFQGVLLRGHRSRVLRPRPVSIPLFSGRITAQGASAFSLWRHRLNPFVFRAYYCGAASGEDGMCGYVSIPLFSGRITAADERLACALVRVSIPLFSGRITAMVYSRKDRHLDVSIPLFSGRITARHQLRRCAKNSRLNPFVFRAYYCARGGTGPDLAQASQSLCFQGVLLRRRAVHPSRGVGGLNPFVFRAYYCA